MSLEQLVELARRNLAHAKAGTVDQAPGVLRLPASNYTDGARFRRERERVFRRLPLSLAFSAELREPGSYRAIDAAGVPVLIHRGRDGELRAFVNACRHRGAMLVEEGCGEVRRFRCPYHGWIYDDTGTLRSVLDAAEFGDVDHARHGLVRLPVDERAGIVFVTPTPEPKIGLDAFLQGYGELLADLRLDECTLVGRQSVAGPHWKLAYDGYLDLYHLPILHEDTFGPDFPNRALYDAWGPHQRVATPFTNPEKLESLPEDEWPLPLLTAAVYTIFPHVSIAAFDADGPLYMVSQLLPGSRAGESITHQHFLALGEVDEQRRAAIDAQMKFLLHVVRDEDYATGLRQQRALESGAVSEVLFGRNEGGGQRFHAWVQALLDSEDADLEKLFASRVGPDVA